MTRSRLIGVVVGILLAVLFTWYGAKRDIARAAESLPAVTGVSVGSNGTVYFITAEGELYRRELEHSYPVRMGNVWYRETLSPVDKGH